MKAWATEREGGVSRDGESDRFRSLYDDCHRPILAYFLRRLPESAAYDATADVFLVAWRRLDDVPRADPLPWLFGVAHNVLRNQERAGRRRRRLLGRLAQAVDPPVPDPAEVTVDGDRRSRVLAAVNSLPARDREVVRLAYWEELPHSVIAQVMGCSVGAIDVRLHRAVRAMAKELAEAGHEVGGRPAVLPRRRRREC